MKRTIASVLRRMANRIDPPPPPATPIPQIRINMPVFPPEVAARIGKEMARRMKARPQFKVPVLPSPPPAPPAPRRLR